MQEYAKSESELSCQQNAVLHVIQHVCAILIKSYAADAPSVLQCIARKCLLREAFCCSLAASENTKTLQ